MRRLLAVAASAAVAASTIALAAPSFATNTISGGGSSFAYPFMSACLSGYNATQSDFAVQYASTGSGTGKSNFQKGVFVYGQTDSQYAATATPPSFGYHYLPDIGGAIAFPINLRNAATNKTLGSSIQLKQVTLAKIMAGKITSWRDKEILAEQTPAIAKVIPATNITVVYRSDASGTSNNTLGYLNAWAPTIWSVVQDNFGTAFPGGAPLPSSQSGKGNAADMALIDQTPGAIGYVDYSDAKGYPVARIQNALGQYVAPSAQSAAKNLAVQTNIGSNGWVTLDHNVKVNGAYPAAIFSYGLVRDDGQGPNGLGVRQFFDYVIQKCGPTQASGLGYVPVSGSVLAKAKDFVTTIK